MYESWQKLMDHLMEVNKRGSDNPRLFRGYLESIPSLFRDLLLFEDNLGTKGGIAHYTSWEKAVEIMEGGTETAVRMYNYEATNDPQEGKVYRQEWSEIEEQASWLDEAIGKREGDSLDDASTQGSAYGCSFSSGCRDNIGDNLSFWRLYGNDGDGCSFMVPFNRPDMYCVRYYDSAGRNDNEGVGSDEQTMRLFARLLQIGKQLVEEFPSSEMPEVEYIVVKNLRRLRSAYRHLAKSHNYRDEREWRMVKIAPERNDIQFDVTDARQVKRYVNGPLWKELLIKHNDLSNAA